MLYEPGGRGAGVGLTLDIRGARGTGVGAAVLYVRGGRTAGVGLAIRSLREAGMRYSFNIRGATRRDGVGEGVENCE